MDLGLKGKTALVTGASSGLGYAAAEALAAEGASLIINSRSEDRLKTAARNIEGATGHRPIIVAADVATDEGIKVVAETVWQKSEAPVDILVSNAGGPPPGQFLDLEGDQWHDASRLVLEMAVRLTYLVLRSMVERRWGRLIYITSIGVLQPIDDLILSNTYRAGVTAFCKTLSNNYAQYGVTANCVCPGYTATERLENLAANRARAAGRSAEAILENFADMAPAKRLGQPEELAALISFLASQKAGFITGTSIAVDGGLNKALV